MYWVVIVCFLFQYSFPRFSVESSHLPNEENLSNLLYPKIMYFLSIKDHKIVRKASFARRWLTSASSIYFSENSILFPLFQ